MSIQRHENSKTALVLAGGGLTGAVYEIGALRAVDDLLVDRTVNDFDIYVGTSAGALVASGLANGISPESLLQAIEGSHPEIKPIKLHDIFALNGRGILKRSLSLPGHLVGAWGQYLRNLGDMSLVDLLWSLTEALPVGLYDSMALERYLRAALSSGGYTNRFEDLPKELYIIATDLDTGERAVFGPGEQRAASISTAVAASAALPLVYKPVRIGDRDYVDGGLRGNASLDIAIEHGATLILCINPMVPFDHQEQRSALQNESKGGPLSDKGLQAVASQVTRIASHANLHYHIKQLSRRHPEVDIILIEPRPDDQRMFFYNIMRYSVRSAVARHGFETVTLDLAEDFQTYKQILARHRIPISRRLVIQELAEIRESGYDPQVIRSVLEARTPGCGQKNQGAPQCKLTRALAELDLVLERLAME
jgi:predicted acylesterase/phospholipase RssA